ncbi:MAG: hypothetical protein JO097_07635 [Acidobacteriaceae bacterium]|nr:hypothetical protein [Acidobacteriaceae bacterium]MBV9295402.1 hypothetical protein [Acidobacteriaceae bacterium]MBV9764774.1 hypothetical protein [Acidobacteriaceae bacterium]
MLTLFSTPKAFRGRFKIIQENAIRSWTRLTPRPDIILLGDDEGTAEMAQEIGALHIPNVAQNEYGTPLVNSIFAIAEAASRKELMCYVNADIILMSDFTETLERICKTLSEEPFLVVGRKIVGIDISEAIDFDDPDWEAKLKSRVAAEGRYGTTDSDYFVFRKGLWPNMPSFAIGRFYWSPWLVYNPLTRDIKVIDATSAITAVEPAHDYSHTPSAEITPVKSFQRGAQIRSEDTRNFLRSPEVGYNAKLFKGCKYWTTVNSSHVWTGGALARSGWKRRLVGNFAVWDYTWAHAFYVNPSLRRYSTIARRLYQPVRPLARALHRYAVSWGGNSSR